MQRTAQGKPFLFIPNQFSILKAGRSEKERTHRSEELNTGS